jgi:nicotinamide-nucleotide amidase
MARRLPGIIIADIYVAVTGLTTPGGSETPEKPVGTMFVHVYIQDQPLKFRKIFQGSCESIIHQTVNATAELITIYLKQYKQ